jgi:hypothetical protein
MDLGGELEKIRGKYGQLTPALIVEEARDPAHPLHPRFCWDDDVAAEAWRRCQAHELIRSVRVVYKAPASGDKPVREQSVRAYHATYGPQGVAYERAEDIAHNDVASAVLLAEMERDWRALKKRYADFAEFRAMILADISELEAELQFA